MTVRTSLNRAPSSLTAEELAAREHALERELFERHGAVIVRLRKPDLGLPRLVTIAIEAWAKTRFGRRAAA